MNNVNAGGKKKTPADEKKHNFAVPTWRVRLSAEQKKEFNHILLENDALPSEDSIAYSELPKYAYLTMDQVRQIKDNFLTIDVIMPQGYNEVTTFANTTPLDENDPTGEKLVDYFGDVGNLWNLYGKGAALTGGGDHWILANPTALFAERQRALSAKQR
jgi:hypothetical protein